jgi:two-component system, OmpR family, response regulator
VTDATPAPRILIVDDNADAATTLAFLLTAAGFETETAFDGETALEVAARFRPTACVLDINMPGMNGYQLAAGLRRVLADAPPVLATVTAYSDYDHLERAADAGFDLHFTKPASPTEIADELGRYLLEVDVVELAA